MAVIDLREDPRIDMAIGQNIGQAIGSYAGYKISERRRQEAETALMKILQRRASDPENYSEDQALADTAGIPRYADMAAKTWASNIQSQQEKEYQAARTKYWSEGGARGAGSGGIEGMTITELQNFRIKEEKAKTEYEAITNQPANKLKKDPARLAEYDRQIQLINKRISELMGGGKPTAGPAPVPFKADVDAVTMAAPITGQPPSAMPGQQQSSFDEMATRATDQWLQPPSATPVSPSKSPQQPSTAGNMGPPTQQQKKGSFKNPFLSWGFANNKPTPEQKAKYRAMWGEIKKKVNEKVVGPGFPIPAGNVTAPTPQQAKADAAIAEIVAPETQLAPSTQAEPQSGQYPKISSPEELDALPSGTLFIAPNGELRRKK